MPKRILIIDNSSDDYARRWQSRLEDKGHKVEFSPVSLFREYDLILARLNGDLGIVNGLKLVTLPILFYGSSENAPERFKPEPEFRKYISAGELDTLLITYAEGLWDENPES